MKKVFFSFYGLVIMMILYGTYICGPIVDLMFRDLNHSEDAEELKRLSRGVFFVMAQDLERLPPQQWAKHIETLKPKFGYGIEIVAYADIRLEENQMAALRQGQIVCDEDLEYFYHQIGDSRMVLRKGPLSELSSAYKESIDNGPPLILVWWSLILIFMSFPCAIWGLFFWRKLRIINMSAAAFGAGDFNTRVNIGRRSVLAPIAKAYNAMADRIQRLIDSHKELTNAVSHELRSPIARIRFGLEMQKAAPTPERRQHYTRGLKSDVSVLEDLVAELLTFAGFDRDKPDLRFTYLATTPWLIQQLADASRTDCRAECQAFYPEKEEHVLAWFEPKYLGRAIGNLIQNAQRHAIKQIHLTFEPRGVNCFIHVDDDGPGIAAMDRRRVFKPFTRLDASRSRASGGYGLGLAIVQRIMTWHNGSVAVSDAPLGGARFTIQWPGFTNPPRADQDCKKV